MKQTKTITYEIFRNRRDIADSPKDMVISLGSKIELKIAMIRNRKSPVSDIRRNRSSKENRKGL